MPVLPGQRQLFDLPEDVAYINCAYMSPLMKAVVDAGRRAIEAKTRPWELVPEDFFTTTGKVRRFAGEVIGAPEENMAIVPAASYAAATASRNLSVRKGQNIIALQDQFPSNIYAWKELAKDREAEFRLVAWPQDFDWTRAILEEIDDNTALVATPHCHWTNGALINLEEVSQACKSKGAALFLDLTQSAGAWPVSMETIQPDFAVFAGYKWAMGPYSLGYMYVAPKWLEGNPLEHNWIARKGSDNFVRLVDYQDEFAAGAQRFDMGERSNFQLMPMAEAALSQILDWGVENIAETLSGKNREIVVRGEKLGLRAAPEDLRAGHYLGLVFPDEPPNGILETLAKEKVFVSIRGNSLRITPHLYNTDEDIDRLFGVLETFLR